MFKVVLKLRSNHLLQHLGQEKELGDKSVVGKNFWVHCGLLEEETEDCDLTLQARFDTTSLKGEVDTLGDQGAENWDV